MQASQNPQATQQATFSFPQSQQAQAQPQPQAMTQQQQSGKGFAAAPVPQQQVNQVQQQQQHFAHQGLNGGWQSDKDYSERRKMIAKIVHLLQQRKPNAPPEWLKKLPQMAKRLEESLYRSAKSFEEYNNATTLKHRLQQLAVNIGMKTKKMQQTTALKLQQTQGSQQAQSAQPQAQQPQTINPNFAISQSGHQVQPLVKPQTQQHALPHTAITQPAPAPPQQTQPQQVKLEQINPHIGGLAPQAQVSGTVAAPAAAAPAPVQFAAQQPLPAPVSVAPAVPAQVNGSNNTVSQTSQQDQGQKPVSDRQQVLRHQQQRLLLLRHAAKCQHEDNRCPVTPHCAGMKRLWKHIAECKNQKCMVPHCVSSRYVLSHYHRCKDVRCPVCGPVREAIHRSHEKQKHMIALRERHKKALEEKQMQVQPQSAAPVTSGPAPSSGTSILTTAPTPVASNTATTILPPSLASSASNSLVPAPSQVPSTTPVHSGKGLEPPNKRIKSTTSTAMPAAPGLISEVPQAPASAVAAGAPITQNGASAPSVLALPVGSQMPDSLLSQHQTSAAVATQPASQPGQPAVGSVPAIAGSQIIMPKYSGPKPQEDHTLINCFSVEQIETHIASLQQGPRLPPNKLKAKCLEVLKILQGHQHAWVFNTPVDPVDLRLPDYFEVIKKPMDLGTIRRKLENGVYTALEEFEAHVHLTFDNAMLYNPEGSVVYNMAKEMKAKFQMDYEKMMQQLNCEEERKRRNGEACSLCGCEKLLFEPPVFYCNGMNCPSKRIRRNSYYYVYGNNQYHWCHQCFQDLRDNASIEIGGDISIQKESLVKKKNDEVHEESWVQCDRCERWVHQICALFNTRQNKDQRSEFACPRCTIEERKRKGITEATSSTPMAEDLPRTLLSEYLENHVRQKVDEFVEARSKEIHESEGVPIEEARKNVQMGGAITIRQVTSMDRRLEVRDRMKARYAFKNYPEEFTFRCKCIIVFQNLDGVDVILFGLYVYEHDEKNPPPNQRAVYISYLDSVHYMRPRQMRKLIYHEILISYLDYVRRRGFATAHIWACPPLKGDDYILYAKPEDQKIPKDERLRQWYIEMLVECQRRGIVGKVTNMYDLYFSDPRHDATVVPYMDGDYFPAEVENIIKDIEEGKTGKKGSSASNKNKKKDKKAKQKKKSGRGGTRSAGLDEEALKASGIVPVGSDSKSLQEGGRDYVMVKLGETIQPMKESFIVAFLCWKGAKEEDMVVPKAIQEYREQHGITHLLPDDPQHDSNNDASSTEKRIEGSPEPMDAYPSTKQAEHPTTTENGVANGEKAGDSQAAGSSDVAGDSTNTTSSATVDDNTRVVREGKFAAMAARKRDREGVPKESSSSKPVEKTEQKEKAPKPTMTVVDSKGRRVKVIDDDEEELDCEFLNNRQAFLNLCQGNHYQFDYLRRAKHSSMMVLWHLHNRDAPKFVQQCGTCSREILTGYRFHCPTCADFDQCQECVSNPKIPRHAHMLKPVPVGNNGQSTSELTEAQRKERQRSIQLHMTLLLHASTCTNPKCPSTNCPKMKGLLKHGAQCQIKATGGCNVCKRIWALLQIHARQCKAKTCSVPNCMAIRERVRQLKKQQQAMDDRRRQEMNQRNRGKR